VASEEYRRDLKKIYAQLEEPRGWGGPEVAELREGKWERVLAALLRRVRKTDNDALEAPKSAKWKICMRMAKLIGSEAQTELGSWEGFSVHFL
jgi:hypothetical protein